MNLTAADISSRARLIIWLLWIAIRIALVLSCIHEGSAFFYQGF
jgi:hypothetical protein